MRSFTLRDISLAGLVAAVYALLTLVLAPISFGVYQIRIAEALTVLPFLSRGSVPGLFIGCMLANAFGGLGYQDIVFGSLITLAAAVCTRFTYYLSNSALARLLAALPLVVLWASGLYLVAGDSDPIWTAAVGLGAALTAVAATLLWLKRSRLCVPALAIAMVSLVLLLSLWYMVGPIPDVRRFVWGAIATVTAWCLTVWLSRVWYRGDNPLLFLAPLPPVLLNAFGVSLYLAPIIEVDYWFCVQMVGVGQLIACYLLGLPLLRLLEARRHVFESRS